MTRQWVKVVRYRVYVNRACEPNQKSSLRHSVRSRTRAPSDTEAVRTSLSWKESLLRRIDTVVQSKQENLSFFCFLFFRLKVTSASPTTPAQHQNKDSQPQEHPQTVWPPVTIRTSQPLHGEKKPPLVSPMIPAHVSHHTPLHTFAAHH